MRHFSQILASSEWSNNRCSLCEERDAEKGTGFSFRERLPALPRDDNVWHRCPAAARLFKNRMTAQMLQDPSKAADADTDTLGSGRRPEHKHTRALSRRCAESPSTTRCFRHRNQEEDVRTKKRNIQDSEWGNSLSRGAPNLPLHFSPQGFSGCDSW